MMLLVPLLSLAGCSGSSEGSAAVAELEVHRQWLAACQSNTASFEACRAHCAARTVPAERTDCFFQLAEAAPRWSNGDPRAAVNIAYSICGSSPDFAPQCFRHSLHEIGLTCSPRGVAWADEPGFQGGEQWARWQACVADRVLERLGRRCLMPVRDSYHNLWKADDAPYCGL